MQDENENFNFLAYLSSNLRLYQNIGNNKENSCQPYVNIRKLLDNFKQIIFSKK